MTMIWTAFVLGLLGSLHCLGMCGPIAFMLPLDREHKRKKAWQLFVYHSGRVMVYTAMGLAFGLLGRGLQLFGVQQKLSVITGILMIVMVLVPGHYFGKFSSKRPVFAMVSKIKTGLGDKLKQRKPGTFFAMGALNGLLPCGLVYTAILGAVTFGNWEGGAAYMALFGVGTVPMMTSVVYLGALIKTRVNLKIKRLIPVFVVIIGVLFILRGMGLGIPYVSPKATATHLASAPIECHQP